MFQQYRWHPHYSDIHVGAKERIVCNLGRLQCWRSSSCVRFLNLVGQYPILMSLYTMISSLNYLRCDDAHHQVRLAPTSRYQNLRSQVTPKQLATVFKIPKANTVTIERQFLYHTPLNICINKSTVFFRLKLRYCMRLNAQVHMLIRIKKTPPDLQYLNSYRIVLLYFKYIRVG